MSKSIFKKTAAIVCSAATLVALSATAMLASAEQKSLTKEDRAADLAAEGPTLMADKVICDPGDKVEYGFYIANNEGFAASGGYFDYDAALIPYVYKDDDAMDSEPWQESFGINTDPEFKASVPETATSYGTGRGNSTLTVLPSVNGKEKRFAFGTIGQAVNTSPDGYMFFCYFQVPEDAAPGTTYPVKLTISQWLDKGANAADFTSVDGWIKIRDNGISTESTTSTTDTTTSTTESTTTTTESTTSTTESTTSTTESTTSTTESTTSTTESTTSTTESTTSTTDSTTSTTDSTTSTTDSTTSTTDSTTSTTDSTTSTSDTASNDGSTDTTSSTTNSTTTTTNPNNGKVTPSVTNAPGAKTGDAGVGAAVAGLLLAAGAAVAVASKKKED